MAVREWEGRIPSFEQFEEAIGRVESTLIQRFRRLRENGIETSFSMVLASVDTTGKASIYLFDERGLAEPVHDNPGFAVIGTGFFTGGNLLLRLLGYEVEKSYMIDIGILSTFIIDVVSEIDPAVGSFLGESWYMRVEGGEVLLGPLKEEAIKDYKVRASKRKELVRRMWRLLDSVGEHEIESIFNNLEKKMLEEEESATEADAHGKNT
jgi:DNA-binding Lrp family transcriptional regulator